MTTTTTTAMTGPVAASGTTPIAFTFQSISAAEVGVLRNGVETLTGFTVQRNADGTGTITPTSTWGTDAIIIFSKPALTQPYDFAAFGPQRFDQLNDPLDRIMRTLIAINDGVKRSFKVNYGKNGLLATGAGVLGVDGNGDAIFYPAGSFNGTNGTNGTNAANPNFTFAVNTLAAGNNATLGVTGTYPNLTLTFGVPAGPSGGTTWGAITGTLSGQTDLNTALGNKAPTASPTFTGTVTIPTPAADDNSTKAASTAYVLGQLNSTAGTITMNGTQAAGSSLKIARADHVHPTDTTRAPLASPTFTGTPAGPTATFGTNTTQLASTAFVDRLRDANALSATGARALVLTDRGSIVANTTGGWSIPANSSVAFPVGTIIFLYNNSDTAQTISITTDTLRLDGTTSTGARTLAGRSMGFLTKPVSTTEWVAGGKGMT